MEKFHLGDVVYHKATKQRCVIIGFNNDGTIKVRTDNDKELHYYLYELETEEEIDTRNQIQFSKWVDNSDPYE